MTVYIRPDVYTEIKKQLNPPIQPVALGFGALIGITEKGPLRVVIRTRTFEEWTRIYGRRETRSDMAYEAEAFFKEGGVELLTSRVGNYSDIDDNTTYTGVAASRTITTQGVAATSAEKTGLVGPYVLNAGDSFTVDVDNAGATPVTFDAARATKAGSGLSITDINGETLVLSFDSGAPLGNQTVTFTATHAGDPDGAAAEINSQIVGGFAVVNAGEIDISSDTQGTNSLVTIVSGTALTELGHTAGASSPGTGDVANIKNVTTAEVKTVVEADASPATVTENANGSFKISSPTTGVTSELDFTVGLAALGIIVETIVGTAAGGTQNTLKLEAGYKSYISPGERGNDLETLITQNPRHPSAGAGNDLAANITALDTSLQVTSLSGIQERSVIRVWDGTNEEFHQVLDVRNVVTAGVVAFYVDIVGSFTNAFTTATTQIETREFDLQIFEDNVEVEAGRWTQMSMLDVADNYVETLMNDDATGSEYLFATDLDAAIGIGADLPATDSARVALTGGTDETTGITNVDWIGTELGKTGIYALNSDIEFMPVAYVGNNDSAVVNQALQYCESKLFLEYIGHVTLGSSASIAIGYRQSTLGANSYYGCIYAGGIKVYDPEGSGSNPKRSIAGVGAFAGKRAKVDNIPSPNGGPWQAPAGEGDYGELISALDVVDIYDDTDHGNMNDAHINVLRKKGKTAPVTISGSRTLDDSVSQEWRYINTIRSLQFMQKSVADGTSWAVQRNNEERTWETLKDRVDTFLSNLIPQRAFPTNRKELAFFVKMGINDGTMTQDDIDIRGQMIGEVGVALQKPGEFVVWRFAQFQGGTDITNV